jgi:polyphosphate kinase
MTTILRTRHTPERAARRVLEEARDAGLPALERPRFLAISSSNSSFDPAEP